MKNQMLIFLSLLVLVSCKNNEKATNTIENPEPLWIKSRPLSDQYYIGIGSADKKEGSNYIEAAKNNALNDLSSEIKVSLSSNTVYHQNESNKVYNEDFYSTIRTFLVADLEGYSLVDSWQNDQQYWVYYRLSKADYRQQQLDKLEKAKKAGLEAYQAAKDAENNGSIKQAIYNYINAFSAIKAFAPSAIEVTSDQHIVFLDNLIYAGLQKLMSQLKLEGADNTVKLNYLNHFQENIPYFFNYNGKAMAAFNFNISHFNQYGEVSDLLGTDNQGILHVVVKANALQPPTNRYEIQLDLSSLVGKRDDATYLVNKLNHVIVPKSIFEVAIENPKVYISAHEKEFGEERSTQEISAFIQNQLTEYGAIIVNSAAKADLTIKIETDTKLQGKTKDFTTVYLNYFINLIEKSDGKTTLSLQKSQIKGLSLDNKRAAAKAYQQAQEEIKQNVMPKIKAAIL